MKRLGLLGGMSWESSIQYERWINEGVRDVVGGTASADLVIRSFNFADIEALQGAGVRKPIAVRMMGTNEREGTLMLEQAGVAVHLDMETAAREIMRLKQGRNS